MIRTVYPGVHEPMRFFENPAFATGWSEYSHKAPDDLFNDDGQGHALVVTIDNAGAPPQIEELVTGRLHWHQETHELHDEAQLSELIDRLGKRENAANHLLRLCLHGTLIAQAMMRLDELDAERPAIKAAS